MRTRVALATRIRAESGWSDACILNVSSRGLLISSSRVGAEGSWVELRHGEHAVVARVVWRKGRRAGLRAQGRVPVEDIVTLSQASALRLTAPQWPGADRRRQSRPVSHDESRHRSRAFEFVGVAVIAVSLAATMVSLLEQAFAGPLALVEAALGG